MREVDTACLARILADYPEVAAAYLFGSAARGTMGPDSDVDLGLVMRDRRWTALDAYDRLADLASRAEAAAPGRMIDVVVLDPQGPLLRYAVVRDGVCIYEADRTRRIDFESETLSRYLDFKPMWDRMTAGRLTQIRRWAEAQR